MRWGGATAAKSRPENWDGQSAVRKAEALLDCGSSRGSWHGSTYSTMRLAMTAPLRIAPSILSADLGRLSTEIAEVEAAGADWIHVDVMDGDFVPNITVGMPVVATIRRTTTLPLDVHLMIREPSRYIAAFAAAGADVMTIHYEGCIHLQRALAGIRELGKRAGVAINPHTPEEVLRYVLDDVDLILVMSVNPGFSAQAFIPSSVGKLARVREMIDRSGREIDLEVDGGVNPTTIRAARDAGADVVVAGNAVFGQADRRSALAKLRAAAG